MIDQNQITDAAQPVAWRWHTGDRWAISSVDPGPDAKARQPLYAAQPPAAPVEKWPGERGTVANQAPDVDLDLFAHSPCSAGSEPVAWMCEKAIWEIGETQRIGGRWLRYLTFVRPAEAEYTRNITPLYSVSPQSSGMRAALERAQKIIERDYPNGQLAIDIRDVLATPPLPRPQCPSDSAPDASTPFQRPRG